MRTNTPIYLLIVAIIVIAFLIGYNIGGCDKEEAEDNARHFAVSIEISCDDDNYSGVYGVVEFGGRHFNYDSLKNKIKSGYGDNCRVKILNITEMGRDDFMDFMGDAQPEYQP